MAEEKEKLQKLLRELFQFNSADLDFGIYRVMNFKREAIENFIEKDLIKAVEKGIGTGVLASQSEAVAKLKDIESKIRETLGDKALTGDAVLVDAYRDTPLGKQYLDLQAQISGAQSKTSLEVAVFNHLYTFFNRYYDNGDFLSKRRYSRKEKYAIPYNGEEVYLYWANSDQYYVKTGEYFNNYSFKSPFGVKIHFVVLAADVEKDNVKGDKRFFVPLIDKVEYKAPSKEITIPFQYRPLTEQEDIRYHQRNQQEEIIKKALESIPTKLKAKTDALAALLCSHHVDKNGQTISLLEFHLRQYARRNTSDYFVHKDLKGFLTRELDFYLKNEVLNLDEIENAGETRSEGWFQILKTIKEIGGRIIEFLAQIEGFQKRVFEKKKFIIETQYCLTIGNVQEKYYTQIAECEAQWDEWKSLFHIDEETVDLFTAVKSKKERRISFLKDHPTLVIDTKHFNKDFSDSILACYDDLDEVTDGLLVHSENFQALNLLLERYDGKIGCIYIDPPYNTGNDGFLYKDSYQHSSWLSMVGQATTRARLFLEDSGAFMASCDENEFTQFGLALREIFGSPNHVETLVWNKRVPKNDKGIGNIHEYIYLFVQNALNRRGKGRSFIMRKDSVDEIYEVVAKAKKGGLSVSEAEETLKEFYRKQGFDRGITLYCELDPNYDIWGKINMAWPNAQTEGPRYEVVNPVTKKPVPIPQKGWRWKEETFRKAEKNGSAYTLSDGSMMKGRVWYPSDTTTQPSSITYLREVESFLLRSFLSIKSDGSITLDDLGLGGKIDYPKPVLLIERLCYSVEDKEGVFADFFAGSGTTGHALINLNREDGGNRKFLLVELAGYFDSVLLPRIKKVIFTPDWKDGKTTRQATPEEATRSPRIIKYLRLESYDDSLNNIKFAGSQQELYGFDDYLLKYMLSWETKDSETLLNVEKLNQPFDYKLNIVNGQETRQDDVDIPETFAYLLGLRTKTRRVYSDDGRRYLVYRGNVDHREITVIWRNNAGWEKKDYVRDRKFVEEQKLTESTDEIFVNGDSLIQGAQTLDGVFKSRMFGGL